jgi:hypothetical protein
MHGSNGMCPPYVSNCTTFIPMDKIPMKDTDLALAFEEEWAVRYPDIQSFTVDCVVRDIAHHRNAYLASEAFDGLVLFLTRYLKEHPDKYQYVSHTSFRVIANSILAQQELRKKKLQQSPN